MTKTISAQLKGLAEFEIPENYAIVAIGGSSYYREGDRIFNTHPERTLYVNLRESDETRGSRKTELS